MSNLQDFLQLLKKSKFDGYLLNASDEYLDEFVPKHLQRLKWLTGFSGSNGFAIISEKYKAFFTDGRYLTQAKYELDAEFEIYNLAEIAPHKWLAKHLPDNFKLAYDPRCFVASEIRNIKKFVTEYAIKLYRSNDNLIDEIWQRTPDNKHQAEIIADDFSGKNSKDKIKELKFLQEITGKQAYLTCDSATINWLLNLRAKDTEFTPLLHCYFLYNKKNSFLYVDKTKISEEVKQYLSKLNINILSFTEIRDFVNLCNKSKIKIVNLDPYFVSYFFYGELKKHNITINKISDPIIKAKAIKNNIEIEHIKYCHILDGVAKTKFLFWLEQQEHNPKLDEILASEKLLEFRKTHKEFLFPSFNTISAYGENGAIIHYNASTKTNKNFKDANLYLVDSGGQYQFGTTDITRTIAFKKQATKEQKRNFTLVLKGHIALAQAIFPEKTKGYQLDILARKFLWQDNKDYAHGTGHGIGCYLNVHEGPHSISKSSVGNQLKENMLVTNEPGFYLENNYGIRIENVVLIQKNAENNLFFETISLVPLDENLISVELLDDAEKLWLKHYHQDIFLKIADKLNQLEVNWLKEKIAFFS